MLGTPSISGHPSLALPIEGRGLNGHRLTGIRLTPP